MNPREQTSKRPAGTPKRNGRPRSEESRRAILDSTLRLVGEESLSEITIAAIAAEAGVGKATIYRWWPSRTALVLDAVGELPALATPDTGNLVGDLKNVFEQLSELLTDSPLGKVLAHFAADRSAQRDPSVREYFNGRLEPVVEIFDRAIERGELPAGSDPQTLIYLALGPILDRVFFAATPPDEEFIDIVVRTVTIGYPAALETRRDRS